VASEKLKEGEDMASAAVYIEEINEDDLKLL